MFEQEKNMAIKFFMQIGKYASQIDHERRQLEKKEKQKKKKRKAKK